MYSNTAAVFRADLTGALVEQASQWEAGLIGPRAMPIINVDTKTGQYPIFALAAGNLLRNEVTARAPYTAFPRGTRAFTQGTYATQEYGFEEAVDDTVAKDMSRFFDAETLSAKLAMRKVSLAHEIRVAAATNNTTNWGTSTNSSTAYTIANIATFDVGLDVEEALDRLRGRGESASDCTAIMSTNVFTRIRGSTKLQNRLRGIGIASDTILNVSEQAVAEALGLKEVLVGKAYYDAGLENEAFSSTAIWGNTYLWVGTVGTGGGTMSMFGGGGAFTLNWGQYGPPLAVETYRDERITSDIVRSKQHVTEKIVNGNAGTLIATQYS
jgi:hypothetical protein